MVRVINNLCYFPSVNTNAFFYSRRFTSVQIYLNDVYFLLHSLDWLEKWSIQLFSYNVWQSLIIWLSYVFVATTLQPEHNILKICSLSLFPGPPATTIKTNKKLNTRYFIWRSGKFVFFEWPVNDTQRYR